MKKIVSTIMLVAILAFTVTSASAGVVQTGDFARNGVVQTGDKTSAGVVQTGDLSFFDYLLALVAGVVQTGD